SLCPEHCLASAAGWTAGCTIENQPPCSGTYATSHWTSFGFQGWRGHLCQALAPAASALVRALVLRQVDKRRDESRRGRHKCPRHPVIHNFFRTWGGFSMVQPAFQPASSAGPINLNRHTVPARKKVSLLYSIA